MIHYQDGYKNQLVISYAHELPETIAKGAYDSRSNFLSILRGNLIIAQGYAWDGPSGTPFDTKNFMRGSLVHDALYQLMRQGIIPRNLKDAADRELQRICIEDGMSSLRAWWVYQGVKKFGTQSTIGNRDIKVAP